MLRVFRFRGWAVALASLTIGLAGLTAAELNHGQGGMAHMASHMFMTVLRSPQPGDQQKADVIVAAAKTAMAPYQDYHKALADGYKIFLPDLPQAQYHFTKYEYGLAARSQFDPLKPTSLLYIKTPDGGYKLVGAMYTDRVDATEDELNERIPLSVARWHQHINFCKAPMGKRQPTLARMQSSGCWGRSPPGKLVMQQADSFVLISSAGWCTSILMKLTRRTSGPRTMTTGGTTIWITR